MISKLVKMKKLQTSYQLWKYKELHTHYVMHMYTVVTCSAMWWMMLLPMDAPLLFLSSCLRLPWGADSSAMQGGEKLTPRGRTRWGL